MIHMSERKLYDRLRHNIKTIDFQRVETTVGSGVPDVNFCCSESIVEGWIELKKIHRPKRETTDIRIGIRPSQIAWITRRRIRFYGTVWILVQVDSDLYMFDGKDVKELSRPVPQKRFEELAVLKLGGRRWEYEELALRLGVYNYPDSV